MSAPATPFRGARRRITSLLAVALLVTAAALEAGAPDIQSLLEALWVDIPARPMVAPPFSLQDLGGAPVRLADLRGRIVMLYFWTTW